MNNSLRKNSLKYSQLPKKLEKMLISRFRELSRIGYSRKFQLQSLKQGVMVILFQSIESPISRSNSVGLRSVFGLLNEMFKNSAKFLLTITISN